MVPQCSDLLFVVVMLVEAREKRRDTKCARALFSPLWSDKSSVSLRPLYGLFISQRGVDVSVRGSLEAVETKAGHGAWFFSSSLEADVG